MRRTHAFVGAMILLALSGCGTDLNEALILATESGARTFIDVVLSDLYSDLPDLFTIPPAPADSPGGDDSGSGGDDGALRAGDPGIGEQLYTDNSCAACHCPDGTGGCVSTSPGVVGTELDSLGEWLQGDTPHVGGKFPGLSEQDLIDLEAFLAQLGG